MASYKHTILILLITIMFLLFGSVYSIFFVYEVDNKLLDTLKVNTKETEIHKGLHDEITQIYEHVQHIINAKNAHENKLRISLIDRSITKIKASRDICIHNGTVLELADKHHSFKNQGEELKAFIKLKEKVITHKLEGKIQEANRLNEKLKTAGIHLLTDTLTKGIDIVRDENHHKLASLSDNNYKKFILGILICILFFAIGSYFLFLLLKKYKIHNETLESIALKDNLTGVYNRLTFIDCANKYALKPHKKGFIIIFLDIDNFKSINTKHGHHTGNEVLVNFTKRLSSFFAEINMEIDLARFGGDEFVLLLKNIAHNQTHEVLNDLSKYLNYYFISPTVKLRMSTSMGSSHYPTDGNNIDTLLKKADEAMYFAKGLGKNTFKEFEDKMDEIRKYEARISAQLRTSIKNKDDSLSLVYQPIINVQHESQVQECEVLLRWKDKNGKAVPADVFIPIAEKDTLIDDLNLYVIDEVCIQQKQWTHEKKPKSQDIRVSINISGEAETVIKLLDRLLFSIKRDKLKPGLFGIEITERTLFGMSNKIFRKLTLLRNIGMKISLDDFGIGYSSLFYLKKIPLTTVKIDKVFIDEIAFNSFDNTIVKSVINLSHSLGFTVVAEGVEHQKQFDLLKTYGCDYIQGYLCSKPISNKAMLSMAELD